MKRKSAFDKRVLERSKEEVVFRPGQLVQVLRSDLEYTFKVERKRLITLKGEEIKGRFSARRLKPFKTIPGTELHEEQIVKQREYDEAEAERKKAEGERVAAEREAENEAGTSSGDSDTSDDETSSGGLRSSVVFVDVVVASNLLFFPLFVYALVRFIVFAFRFVFG